ncbi:MAG: hypothetical protein H7318_10835 [Oligoflexus sp.]|nr:hypothetical protein [Oligoflexus sp.]
MQKTFRDYTKLFAILSLSVAVAYCNKKSSDASEGGITALTIKIRNADTAAPAHLTDSVKLTSTGAGNLSFTPDSYKLWINTIVLQNDDGSGSNQFYQCETSEGDCEIDFASATSIAAFEAKLSALPISPGTYTKVWMSCTPSSGGYVKVKGKATLADGSTIYTANPDDNSGGSLTTDISKAGTLKISYTGGSCGITMPLATPIVVAAATPPAAGADNTNKEVPAGTTLTMTMFSNLLYTAYYAPNSSPGMGGCRLSDANHAANTTGPAICVIYPSVFPYFGETTPAVEYYKVANSKTAGTALVVGDSNVIVKIIKDADGIPFWTSFGQFYSEDTPAYASGEKGVSGYTNSISDFSINADSTLTMKSQDNGFSAFQRADHTGEVKGEGILNGAGTGRSVTYYYHAFPFTP